MNKPVFCLAMVMLMLAGCRRRENLAQLILLITIRTAKHNTSFPSAIVVGNDCTEKEADRHRLIFINHYLTQTTFLGY